MRKKLGLKIAFSKLYKNRYLLSVCKDPMLKGEVGASSHLKKTMV